MRRWLRDGHVYAYDAVRIETIDGNVWVVDAQDGYALKLFVHRADAKKAIDRAVDQVLDD